MFFISCFMFKILICFYYTTVIEKGMKEEEKKDEENERKENEEEKKEEEKEEGENETEEQKMRAAGIPDEDITYTDAKVTYY